MLSEPILVVATIARTFRKKRATRTRMTSRTPPNEIAFSPRQTAHAERACSIMAFFAESPSFNAHPCAPTSRTHKDRRSSICIRGPHWTRSAFHRSFTGLNPRASTLILAALRLAALHIRILLGLCAPHRHLAKERPGPTLALFLLHFYLE